MSLGVLTKKQFGQTKLPHVAPATAIPFSDLCGQEWLDVTWFKKSSNQRS